MFNIGSIYLFLCGDKAIVGQLTHAENGVFALRDARNVLNWKSRPALRRLATDGIIPSEDTEVSKQTSGTSTDFIFAHSVDQAFLCDNACREAIVSLSNRRNAAHTQSCGYGCQTEDNNRDEQ